jgi:hypothetical protein
MFEPDIAYIALTDEQQKPSGVIALPSGEANFANLFSYDETTNSGQIPELMFGINKKYKEGWESGVIHIDSGRIHPHPGSGTKDSAFAFELGYSNFSSADAATRNRVNLSVFRPYIHYYPTLITNDTSTYYSNSLIPRHFVIDYSLVFKRASGYNSYDTYSFDFSSVVDSDGNPIFETELIPPIG